MNEFDLGPVRLFRNGTELANFARINYDGIRVVAVAEYRQPHPVKVLDVEVESIDSLGNRNYSFVVDGDNYKIGKANGCGCRYSALAIKRMSLEEMCSLPSP